MTDANYSWKFIVNLYEWPQWSFINADIIKNALKDLFAHI